MSFAIQQFEEEFFAAADSLIPEKWFDYFSDDADIRFGDTHYAGKEALVKNFPLLQLAAYSNHTIENVWYNESTKKACVELEIVFKIKGDPEQIAIHARGTAIAVIDEEKRKIKEYRVYLAYQEFLDRLAYVMSLNNKA